MLTRIVKALRLRKTQLMFKPLSLFLGLRYVRSRHGNGFSSFISASSTVGIALGVMVLIVVLSAMNGFERELTQRLLSVVPHAEMITVDKPIPHWPKNITRVLKHPQVIAAAPVIKMTGMMQHGNQLKGLEIRGVDIALEQQVSAISDIMIAGSWEGLDETPNTNSTSAASAKSTNGVVIGSGVAKKLQVTIGDKVQLLLPRPSNTSTDSAKKSQFSAPIKRNVEVVGIFEFGGTIDDTLAYMSLQQASDIMGYSEGEAQGIRLKLADVFNAQKIVREIAYGFDFYVYIYDWTRTQGHVFNDIQLVRMVMFIVLILVISVASFNIVSTLIMAVNEKKGDIAILKTMGAPTSTIMTTFVIQGMVNGVLGSVVGGLLGVYTALNLTAIIVTFESWLGVHFLSADVYFIDYIPSELHWPDVYLTVITALVLSIIATIYPAWRATKVEPALVLGQL
jgi:lipoprotein-releasing system permease protein